MDEKMDDRLNRNKQVKDLLSIVEDEMIDESNQEVKELVKLKLEELNLNTLNYFITKDKQVALHYLAKHVDDKLSLRTEKGSEFNCPYYYKVKGKILVKEVVPLIEEGYTLIFAESLDTKGCILFGAIGLKENTEAAIDFVVGQGKVRELDTHPERRSIIVPPGSLMAIDHKELPGKAHIINTLYKQVKDLCYDHIPCIVEFSYYDRPVGRLNKNEVFL